MFGTNWGLLPTLWPMRSDTTWAVCTTGRIRLGTVIMNCRRFVLGNAGTKEAKGTGRSCPTIPTLLLMATGFPFSRIRALATSEPRSATRAPRTMLRCFPSPHPTCPTSGPPRFKPFFQPFSIVGTRRQFHFVQGQVDRSAARLRERIFVGIR